MFLSVGVLPIFWQFCKYTVARRRSSASFRTLEGTETDTFAATGVPAEGAGFAGITGEVGGVTVATGWTGVATGAALLSTENTRYPTPD